MNTELEALEAIQKTATQGLAAGNSQAAFAQLRDSMGAFNRAAASVSQSCAVHADATRLQLAREVLPMLKVRNLCSKLVGDTKPPAKLASWLATHDEQPVSTQLIQEWQDLLKESAQESIQLGERLASLTAEVAGIDARNAIWSRFVLYFRLAMLAEEKTPATFDETLAGFAADELPALAALLPTTGRQARWLGWEKQFRDLVQSIQTHNQPIS